MLVCRFVGLSIHLLSICLSVVLSVTPRNCRSIGMSIRHRLLVMPVCASTFRPSSFCWSVVDLSNRRAVGQSVPPPSQPVNRSVSQLSAAHRTQNRTPSCLPVSTAPDSRRQLPEERSRARASKHIAPIVISHDFSGALYGLDIMEHPTGQDIAVVRYHYN